MLCIAKYCRAARPGPQPPTTGTRICAPFRAVNPNHRPVPPVILRVLMLANGRAPWQFRIPPIIRLSVLAVFVAAAAYYVVFDAVGEDTRPAPPPETGVGVVVPQLDDEIVAAAKDDTREQRLVIQPEPLRHLLEKAIDVSPAAALALGRPEQPVPLTDLRAEPDTWRGRWLWFKGELEELHGPKEGHPVEGYKIYEATVRLDDDERVMAHFSLNEDDEVRRGGIVRVEGFFLKLRDTTYPRALDQVPLLVGREIVRDYRRWGPVTEFDPTIYEGLDDEDPFPGSLMWLDVEDDQGPPLWHLAAFARDTRPLKTLEDWRKHPVLNHAEWHEKLVNGKVARGQPIRILGTLKKRRAIAAPPNPIGVDYWTMAYLQVTDYGGLIVPVWLPERLSDMPIGTDLEVRGYYYRWWAYESLDNVKRRAPLFVAATLDPYDLGVDETMESLGFVIGSALLVMLLMIFVAQRRAKTQSERHAEQMAARRRRRQNRATAAAAGGGDLPTGDIGGPPPLG